MFQRVFALFGYVPAAAVTVDKVAAFKADVAKATSMLDGDYNWRSLKAVRTAVGVAKKDCPYVVAVLKAAGARPSYRNKHQWGLKSRVGESGRRSSRY